MTPGVVSRKNDAERLGYCSCAQNYSRRHFAAIALLYTAIAIVMTWPLMRHPSTTIASDLGDSLFVCWVLMWTSGQVLAALRGNVAALADYWNGNIFYPAPHTIAYSEHFTPQMLQMLPVYAAGGNILLCYNLLFLSTFVIAALGMYLFVRDITGRPLAAFLAGLAFAYAPYRLGQFPHLQVMSIGWMPLALLGLRRFFSTGRTSALAGAAAAFVVQGLSCGYYLLFFSPLFAAFGLYEMIRRRMLGQWRVWLRLAVAALVAALVLYPFLRPYLDARASGATGARSVEDAAMFAADTHAFATIAPNARLLASYLQGYPKPEGEGFPGFTILTFTAIGLGAAGWRTLRRIPWASVPRWMLALWSALFTTFVDLGVRGGDHVRQRPADVALGVGNHRHSGRDGDDLDRGAVGDSAGRADTRALSSRRSRRRPRTDFLGGQWRHRGAARVRTEHPRQRPSRRAWTVRLGARTRAGIRRLARARAVSHDRHARTGRSRRDGRGRRAQPSSAHRPASSSSSPPSVSCCSRAGSRRWASISG